MSAIGFTVPLAPRGWARARKNGNQFFKDPATAAFEACMGHIARVTMCGRTPMTGPLELTVVSVMPVPASWSAKKRAAALAGTIRPTAKPDWDNLGKMTDALNGIVWGDDAQVVDGRSVKFYGAEPAMHIEVRPAILNSQSASRPAWQSDALRSGPQQKAWIGRE